MGSGIMRAALTTPDSARIDVEAGRGEAVVIRDREGRIIWAGIMGDGEMELAANYPDDPREPRPVPR